MKKNAWIRSDKGDGIGKCPFGLPIIEGCTNAGNSVSHMCPLKLVQEDRRQPVKKANSRVYIYYKTGDRCIYASNIMKNHNVVNCDFGDTGAGIGSVPLSGSPLYPNIFSGVGINGLYAFPLGFYGDNDTSRNLFLGLFSLVGNKTHYIIKQSYHNKELENILKKICNKEMLNSDEHGKIIVLALKHK